MLRLYADAAEAEDPENPRPEEVWHHVARFTEGGDEVDRIFIRPGDLAALTAVTILPETLAALEASAQRGLAVQAALGALKEAEDALGFRSSDAERRCVAARSLISEARKLLGEVQAA